MKNTILPFLLLLFVYGTQAQTLKARVKIDIEKEIGSVDSLIYGIQTDFVKM
jgi:hypothetical protein